MVWKGIRGKWLEMFSRERLNFVSVILDAGRKCRGKFIVTRIKKGISTAYSFFLSTMPIACFYTVSLKPVLRSAARLPSPVIARAEDVPILFI